MEGWAMINISGLSIKSRAPVHATITGLLVALWTMGAPGRSFAADALPRPEPSFKGKVATSVKDSVPDWPQPPKAPAGAPNIVLILWDDIGFADTSTFGGLAR